MGIEVGSVLEGKVTGIKSFGAFVSLPDGKNGLVHISEVSNSFVQDINTVLKEGETVKVKVMSIADDGKIALSIKRLLPREPREGHDSRDGGKRYGDGNSGGRPYNGSNRGDRNDRGERRDRRPRSDAPRVWQPRQTAQPENMSFEDMMSRFKSQSEDKLATLNAEQPHIRRGSNRGHRK